jgi:ribosomal-protein-alanine N-acetyltransferase
MKHIGTQTIETERLILRRFELKDAKNMFDNYASKDKVTEYLTWHPHKNIEDTKEYLLNVVLPSYEKLDTYRWAIVWKENNQVIGAIDVVNASDERRKAELGWVIGDEYWGRGIMPEAGREVLKYLFSVGYERIEALHDVKNAKSGRVMDKIGMKHEGLLRKYTPNRDNILVDCDIWAITK